MNKIRINQHKADLANNYAGVLAVRNSLDSLLFRQIIPFTKNDLHCLYICIKAVMKMEIEMSGKLSENEKSQKSLTIDLLMDEVEHLDLSSMTSDPYYPRAITNTDEIARFTAKVLIILFRIQNIYKFWQIDKLISCLLSVNLFITRF